MIAFSALWTITWLPRPKLLWTSVALVPFLPPASDLLAILQPEDRDVQAHGKQQKFEKSQIDFHGRIGYPVAQPADSLPYPALNPTAGELSPIPPRITHSSLYVSAPLPWLPVTETVKLSDSPPSHAAGPG